MGGTDALVVFTVFTDDENEQGVEREEGCHEVFFRGREKGLECVNRG
jgi:hypothetical protein